MPNVNPQNEPAPKIAASAANDNSVKILREEREKLEQALEALMDDPPAPAVKRGPKDMHDWLMAQIAAAHVGDPFGYEAEIAWLMRDDYVDALKNGLAPPVISAPFRNYLPTPQTPGGLLLGLEVWRKRFAVLHKRYMGGEEAEGEAVPLA